MMIDICHSVGMGLGLVDTVRGAGPAAVCLASPPASVTRWSRHRARRRHPGLAGPRANARAMKRISASPS
jgi:hypothetical protein